MNLHDFRQLEKELGHPPTQAEVRAYTRRPMLKTAYVQFADTSYNYHTSVNGKLSDAEISKYFLNQWFNMGHLKDDMQKCIAVQVMESSISLN